MDGAPSVVGFGANDPLRTGEARGEVRNRLLGVTDLTNLERTGGPLGSFSCNGRVSLAKASKALISFITIGVVETLGGTGGAGAIGGR